ncbi:MAG TPA: SRPBCC domain-containing protein [Candidatus Kapabacteria bacterium]|nr:SRPBCC domain-containing protein [Candidatus Kapabacteria bacterium]
MNDIPTSVPVVEKTIEISAPPSAVWRALTEPEQIEQWMGGSRMESAWEPGAAIRFTGKLHEKMNRDRATVLAVDHERLLRYSYWTEVSEFPDLPEHRTVITLSLEGTGNETRLSVRHENFHDDVAYKHGNFFWGGALAGVKKLVERQHGEGGIALRRHEHS